MMHSANRRLVDYERVDRRLLEGECFLSRFFLQVIMINMKFDPIHIRNNKLNELHRHKLEFTYELIGNFLEK
jgi:hypothetical protein